MMTSGAAESVLKLDITVDPDHLERDALAILVKIRPDWRQDEIKFTKFTMSGFVNIMLKAYTENDVNDAVVIRVFCAAMDYMMNRGREINSTMLLHEFGISPRMYCSFNNGLCTEFISGRIYDWTEITKDGIHDRAVFRCTARELAKFHTERLAKAAVTKYCFKEECELFKKYDEFQNNWPTTTGCKEADEILHSSYPSKDILFKEMKMVLDALESLGDSLRFCHNDANPSNIIYCEKEGRVVYVDYEFSSFSWPIWDIAIFLEYSAIGLNPDVEGSRRYPDDFIQSFLRDYLEARREYGDLDHDVTDLDVKQLFVKTYKAILLFYVTYSSASILLSCQPPRQGLTKAFWVRIGVTMYNWYLKNKERILAMKVPE